MNQYSFDVHMHTHYSYDSLMTPRFLTRKCAKLGLSAIVVTDHNSTKGGFAAISAAEEKNLTISVYVGAEIKTQHGDVIGLFLNEEIKARQYHEVIDEIRAQDGIVYLPHPFASSTHLKEMDLSRIQVLEVYNGRSDMSQNQQAFRLRKKLGIPSLGGSDAHVPYELGSVRNLTEVDVSNEDELRSEILRGTSLIRVHQKKVPFLPQFRMTQFMSWIRSGQSSRVLNRILLFSLRQARRAARTPT